MQKYLQLIEQFHENNPIEIDFIKTQLKGWESQDEVEHMLDFMYSNKHKKLEWLSYKLILAKTKKWDIQLQKVSSKDTEKEWIDFETYLDFWDGFRIVKLISKQCYEREWKLMSHCVWWYFGRNTTIYSLRDSQNKPHCTIEDWNQVKWKWNGSIDPKYVEYVVKFLEKKWMTVWENEMKNLGYHKLDSIDEWLTCDATYNGYIYENKLDQIKDKDGEIYMWFWLFNIKKYFEIDVNMKIKWNFDLSLMLKYFFAKTKNDATSGDESTSATSGNYSTSATQEINQPLQPQEMNQPPLQMENIILLLQMDLKQEWNERLEIILLYLSILKMRNLKIFLLMWNVCR